MADDKKINEIELRLGLLNKDVDMVNTICEKLTDSIEKIQDMNQNVINLIAIHGQKHEQHEKVESELKEDIKEIYARIATVNREIHERVDQLEHHISSRIDALRGDLLMHKKEDSTKKDDGLTNRIADIEKWKWMVVGAIALAAWLVGQADVIGKIFN